MTSEEKIIIPCNGIRLEAVLKKSPAEKGGVVISHPHPLFGGNMDNSVVLTMAEAFFAAGFTTLRFNFRGTKGSSGMFDDGRGEQEDVAACLSFIEAKLGSLPFLAGYSFGAWVNARLLDGGGRVADHIMVSPPVAMIPFSDISKIPNTGLVVTGEADDIAPPSGVNAMRADCGLSGARFEVVPAADHFYSRSLAELQQIICQYLS